MTRTSSSKCPPALSLEEESKGRVARTINLETNRVPHHAGFARGVFDSASLACLVSSIQRLLINVVLRLKPLEQGLQELLRRIRRSADRLRHFFGSSREVSAVRRDAGQRQVADPVIRLLPRNLRIQFKSALGVARSLQAASVRVQLNRAGFIERFGKQFGGFFLFSHGLQDARLGLQILKPLV